MLNGADTVSADVTARISGGPKLKTDNVENCGPPLLRILDIRFAVYIVPPLNSRTCFASTTTSYSKSSSTPTRKREMSYCSDFIPLATVNKTFFSRLDPDIVPSVEPLLHLIPEHVLQKRLIENQWSYTSCDDLPQKDLTPLYLYARYIREIQSRGLSLTYSLRLRDRQDSFLKYACIVIIVELPYYAVDLEAVAFALLAAPSRLRTLVYIDDSANTEFQESLHLFHSLQHLTVSPLQPTATEVITSLPSLESLSVVVYDSLETLPYNITSFEIMLRRSLLFGVFNNHGFDAAISLLHALPIPCHFITSLAQEFDITNHPNFSAVDLRRLSVSADIHVTYNGDTLPIPLLRFIQSTQTGTDIQGCHTT
ncbi:hypothetical protein F4604DRAFT_1686344 [Suillus subluteus]|nr:hypothetical protein F4604DRAFT_1686344 [Suillus subluteus]